MASRNRDAIVGIFVYQQKWMTRFNRKYVWFVYDAQTPRLRHFPTFVIMNDSIAPAVGAEPSPHGRGTVEETVMGLNWYLGLYVGRDSNRVIHLC